MNGYSLLTAHRINTADKSFIGVKLGRLCVKKGIPVRDVAEFLNVSHTAVYAWFKGEVSVSHRYRADIEYLISKLKD